MLKKIWLNLILVFSIIAPIAGAFVIYAVADAILYGAWMQLLIAIIIFTISSGGVLVFGILIES